LLGNANLRDAMMRGAVLSGADLTGAKLERAVLEGADLTKVNLTNADCRNVTFRNAKMGGVTMRDTLLYGSDFSVELAKGVTVDSVDFSAEGNGSARVTGSELAAYFNGKRNGAATSVQVAAAAVAPAPVATTNRRYFGHGDVLRDASLEFDTDSIVEVDGRFLKCNITLGTGAQLIIGKDGLFDGCQIQGSGIVVIHGRFISTAASGISGARRVIVGATGVLKGTVKQPSGLTNFAFESGCVLRLKIETA
jgi:uncharacterized protein YjbI with pentapeptide repeats